MENSILYLIHIFITIFSVVTAFNIVRNNFISLMRPSFLFSLAIIFFYQIPTVFLYDNLGIKNIQEIIITINILIIFLLFWTIFTPSITKNLDSENKLLYKTSEFKFYEIIFLLTLYLIFVFLYLNKIPFQCTGLFSLIYKPSVTLVVRELTNKLVESKYTGYLISLLINVIIPFIGYIAINKIIHCISNYKILKTFGWCFVLFIMLASILLPGVKGNLLPFFTVITVSLFWQFKATSKRILVLLISSILFTIFLISMNMRAGNQSSEINHNYNFGYCVQQIGACENISTFLDSLKFRNLSLGVTEIQIKGFENDVNLFCKLNNKNDITEPDSSFIDKEKKGDNILMLDRIYSLLSRSFKSPLIVANWYYDYTKKYSSPGIYGLSITSKFSDKYINMPSKICEKYETVRSNGDKTSSCSAPTSFIFSYSSYFGLLGTSIVFFLIIIFDLVSSKLIKILTKPLKFIGVGYVANAILNFMITDFTTVLITYGFVFSILILCLFTLIKKNKDL